MKSQEYKLNRLVVPTTMRFMSYNGIRFHLTRDCNAQDWPWDGSPAVNKITSTLSGDWRGLTVFTKKGIIPEDCLDIVVVHEVIEGNEKWYRGRPHSEAHNLAVDFHMNYAKRFKDERTFRRFLEWQNQFKEYESRGFFGPYQK